MVIGSCDSTGATAMAIRGIVAPEINDMAEARAVIHGLAMSSGSIPSSVSSSCVNVPCFSISFAACMAVF